MLDKEVWEPVIDHLFANDGARPRRLIREAWTFDMQNHGEAAVLNEATLQEGKTGLSKSSGLLEYASVIVPFSASERCARQDSCFNRGCLHRRSMGVRISSLVDGLRKSM